jgi:hypothetical protein
MSPSISRATLFDLTRPVWRWCGGRFAAVASLIPRLCIFIAAIGQGGRRRCLGASSGSTSARAYRKDAYRRYFDNALGIRRLVDAPGPGRNPALSPGCAKLRNWNDKQIR